MVSSRLPVRLLVARLLVGLVVLAVPALGSPATASAVPVLPASSAAAVAVPPDADQLERHLKSYVTGRKATASVRVRDLRTGREYSYRSGSRYDSASVVKVAIMAAVLRRQEAQKRYLTAREDRLIRAMIRNSDNDAASSLYASLGRGPGLKKFYKAAGMSHTTPGPGRYWGLTQITAADQVVLLAHLARPSRLLNERGRAYARKQLAAVTSSQAWGVSAGPRAAGARVELKNGWLSRSSRGWRVHSTGHVSGEGRDYLVAVLTMDNRTLDRGIASVEGVAKIVWRDLDPAG